MGITIKRKGMLLIISGPSGAGKGTLCKRLLATDKSFVFSCSVTTRGPREGEVDGVDYRFIDEAEFQRMVQNDELLEYATVHGHHYGTPRSEIDSKLEQYQNVLLDIDSQGAMNVMRNTREYVSVFVIAPSFEELRKRLEKRNAERPEEIQRRLNNAYGEFEKVGQYDYVIVNDDVDRAFCELQSIVDAEKHKTVRFLPVIEQE
ncbi:MAG TPA: guanylate kinase [Candidatus Limiplasma sp.]|nr:guanylate kinase [Candidatus Limiplasma sp.]HRX08088.1 guanylate kinase [Candidatus Limiplasma sp.]